MLDLGFSHAVSEVPFLLFLFFFLLFIYLFIYLLLFFTLFCSEISVFLGLQKDP